MSALALGRARARERDPALHPGRELLIRLEVLRVYAEPAEHLAPAHLEHTGRRGGDERLGLLRIDANQHAPLAARRHGHVAADQECEAAEHFLLGERSEERRV